MNKKRKFNNLANLNEKKAKLENPISIFEISTEFGELLENSGISFSNTEKAVIISGKPSKFLNKFNHSLKLHIEYPDVIDTIIKEITEYIEDDENFEYMLKPVLKAMTNDIYLNIAGSSESFIHICLRIDDLQSKLLHLLLDKITSLQNSGNVEKELENLQLIVRQFCWLDSILDAQLFVEKLFTTITSLNLNFQKEIISNLAEIFQDSEHPLIAKHLLNLISDDDLILIVLDVLTNLNISTNKLEEFNVTIFDLLSSAVNTKLPILLRYLFQTSTNNTVSVIIDNMREKISFISLISSTPRYTQITSKAQSSETSLQILDAIKYGIRYKKIFGTTWIKLLEKSDEKTYNLDFVVLLIMHQINDSKHIEQLIKNKIISDKFSIDTLKNVFQFFTASLQDYFANLMKISNFLLQINNDQCLNVCKSIYKFCFFYFDDCSKQNIVGELVSHIGNSVLTEIGTSLDILLLLVEQFGDQMCPYALFIKGIFDYSDHMTLFHVFKLYKIITMISYMNEQSSGIEDYLFILIHKQLANKDIKVKQMGVVGAVAIIFCLGCAQNNSKTILDSLCASQMTMKDIDFNHIVFVFKLIQTGCTKVPAAFGLFMEELSNIILHSNMNKKVFDWICQHMIDLFEDLIDNKQDDKIEKSGLTWDYRFGLDSLSEEAIAIDFLKLVEDKNAKTIVSSQCPTKFLNLISNISSIFRLVHLCELKRNSNLEAIDAVIGCHIRMPTLDKSVLSILSEDQKHLICDIYFSVANWFRELLNAFAGQESEEMRIKSLNRLHHIIEIESDIIYILQFIKDISYTPPIVYFEYSAEKILLLNQMKQKEVKEKNTKKLKKTKKSTKNKENQQDKINQDSSFATNSISPISKTSNESVSHTKISQNAFPNRYAYYRELDMNAFNILKYAELKFDDNQNYQNNSNFNITPAQFKWLLIDLKRKIKHVYTDVASKSYFGKQKLENKGFAHLDMLEKEELIMIICGLLPAFNKYLSSIHKYFEKKDNDGNESCSNIIMIDSVESTTLSLCSCIIFECLSLFLKDLHNRQNNIAIENCLILLINDQLSTSLKPSKSEASRQILSYLREMASNICYLSTAISLINFIAVIEDINVFENEISYIVAFGFLKKTWPKKKKVPTATLR